MHSYVIIALLLGVLLDLDGAYALLAADDATERVTLMVRS